MTEYRLWTELEWHSVAEVARWYGMTQHSVRLAIQRCQQRALGAYTGSGWTIYAEKHGSEWRIPILVRKEQSVRDNAVRDSIVSVRTFPSRTAFMEYQNRCASATSNAL